MESTAAKEFEMSTPNPMEPDHRTKRQREEQERRRRDAPEQPGKPTGPEIDPPRRDDGETEENWRR
jgi:hypothetical protein